MESASSSTACLKSRLLCWTACFWRILIFAFQFLRSGKKSVHTVIYYCWSLWLAFCSVKIFVTRWIDLESPPSKISLTPKSSYKICKKYWVLPQYSNILFFLKDQKYSGNFFSKKIEFYRINISVVLIISSKQSINVINECFSNFFYLIS